MNWSKKCKCDQMDTLQHYPFWETSPTLSKWYKYIWDFKSPLMGISLSSINNMYVHCFNCKLGLVHSIACVSLHSCTYKCICITNLCHILYTLQNQVQYQIINTKHNKRTPCLMTGRLPQSNTAALIRWF